MQNNYLYANFILSYEKDKITLISLLSLCSIVLATSFAYSQSDFITGLSRPSFLAIKNDTLYVAKFTGGKVLKIDLTADTPSAVTLVSGLTEPLGLVVNGDSLYVSEYTGKKNIKN